VGQWLPIKGKAYLAEAFTHLVQKHSDLRLSCVGTLASESQVLADFPPEVRPHVTVRSRVTGEELLACHRDADIFVFPTLSEGASLALGEAMATGLPIVTTPVGAAPDLLRHGDSAMFVPIRNPGALVETVERLLDDAALRQSLGSAAQASARYLEPDAVLADYAACLNLLPPSGLPTPSDIGLALTPAAR
jgi:glycosyltransferase involved in cell wall biosynthesis